MYETVRLFYISDSFYFPRNENEEKYSDFETDLPTDGKLEISEGVQWSNYFLCGVKGVFEEILSLKEGARPRGMNCLVLGSIPPSAGLSSSSALVVSAALGNPCSTRP